MNKKKSLYGKMNIIIPVMISVCVLLGGCSEVLDDHLNETSDKIEQADVFADSENSLQISNSKDLQSSANQEYLEDTQSLEGAKDLSDIQDSPDAQTQSELADSSHLTGGNVFPTPVTDVINTEILSEYYDEVISIDVENVDKDIFGEFSMNYSDFEIDDIDYEGYRIDGDYDEDESLFVLYPYVSNQGDGTIHGAMYNLEAINGISVATITYESDDDVTVYYGNDRNNLKYSYDLPKADEFTQGDIYLVENSSYFRIETGDEEVRVQSIELYCQGDTEDLTQNYTVVENRYVPDTDYDPYEGEVLSVPVCQTDDNGDIIFEGWKEYTYHSFEFVKNEMKNGASREQIISEYALIEPEDIANYFILFNRIPANFGLYDKDKDGHEHAKIQGDMPTTKDVEEIFGKEYARQVSEYQWASGGYIDYVPVKEYKSGKPLYYEFDIDIDGTYTTKYRGTGRVVGFVGGFETSDDKINSAVFTDDHYYTFMEYSNCGFWNERFDAESMGRTGRIFDFDSESTILKIAN